ncbi:hypothetical protein [uncultured Roseivirga sp.]|uniref:CsbD family protein n=1 Tax=uncultured Roseivirga sp. TaxID=543088 RepID=UPI0030DD7F0D
MFLLIEAAWYNYFYTTARTNLEQQNMKRFLQGNWDQIKKGLKQKYEELKDEDLKYVEGHEEELISKLQVRLDKTKREITAEFKQIITD